MGSSPVQHHAARVLLKGILLDAYVEVLATRILTQQAKAVPIHAKEKFDLGNDHEAGCSYRRYLETHSASEDASAFRLGSGSHLSVVCSKTRWAKIIADAR